MLAKMSDTKRAFLGCTIWATICVLETILGPENFTPAVLASLVGAAICFALIRGDSSERLRIVRSAGMYVWLAVFLLGPVVSAVAYSRGALDCVGDNCPFDAGVATFMTGIAMSCTAVLNFLFLLVISFVYYFVATPQKWAAKST